MSDLHQAIEEYLALRRSLGFKLERQGALLADFAGFSARRGDRTVTIEGALAWATSPAGADPAWWGSRLAVVRSFARWRAAWDPATQVPPSGLLPARSRRAEPYPYSDADIAALLACARSIRMPRCERAAQPSPAGGRGDRHASAGDTGHTHAVSPRRRPPARRAPSTGCARIAATGWGIFTARRPGIWH